MYIKLVIYCLFFILVMSNLNAQLPPRGTVTIKLPSSVFFNEITGRPYYPTEGTVNGSPFLNDEWKRCIIKLRDGRYFENVPVKLNLLNQTLHYNTAAGTEMEVSPGLITGLQIIDTSETGQTSVRHFYCGFNAVGNNDEHTFYEAVVEGKSGLLLCRKVRLAEVKVVGLATQKEYQSSEEYYVGVDSNIVKCKKSASFFIELFADKKDEVKKYIDDQKLKFKSEKDYRRIVTYYNSLWKLTPQQTPFNDLSAVYKLFRLYFAGIDPISMHPFARLDQVKCPNCTPPIQWF